MRFIGGALDSARGKLWRHTQQQRYVLECNTRTGLVAGEHVHEIRMALVKPVEIIVNQAGYYGYLWSLVFACDMFHHFQQQGVLNSQAGMEYRKKILARGGSVDAMDLLQDYLGREPDMTAFLRHLGLDQIAED